MFSFEFWLNEKEALKHEIEFNGLTISRSWIRSTMILIKFQRSCAKFRLENILWNVCLNTVLLAWLLLTHNTSGDVSIIELSWCSKELFSAGIISSITCSRGIMLKSTIYENSRIQNILSRWIVGRRCLKPYLPYYLTHRIRRYKSPLYCPHIRWF